MTRTRTTLAGFLLAMFLSAGLLLPMTARASEAGRRNTTIGLGAATAYFLTKKQWVPAVIAGAGTAVAQHNWQAQINARHRQQNRLAYLARHRRTIAARHRKTTRTRRY